METSHVVMLVVFGIPVVMATLWILGFAVTGIAGSVIAVWEERFGEGSKRQTQT